MTATTELLAFHYRHRHPRGEARVRGSAAWSRSLRTSRAITPKVCHQGVRCSRVNAVRQIALVDTCSAIASQARHQSV